MSKWTPPGAMIHELVIEEPVETKDAIGEVIETWQTAATIFAKVETLSAKEQFITGTYQGVQVAKVNAQYVTGITHKMRVQHDGQTWAIISPPANLDSRNRELEFLMQLGLRDG